MYSQILQHNTKLSELRNEKSSDQNRMFGVDAMQKEEQT